MTSQSAPHPAVGPDESLQHGAGPGGWTALLQSLASLGLEEIRNAQDRLNRQLEDDAVSYASPVSGTSKWAVDPIPVLLNGNEWARLERGLAQRAELLNAIYLDVYGPQRTLRAGLIPPEIIYGHPGYVRRVADIRVPGKHQLFLTATDVGRGADGSWRVLADRIQSPNGAGYAMENRRAVSRALPSVYRELPLRRLAPFYETLRAGLQDVAPRGVESARIALFSSGPTANTAFDQEFLASILGFPVVTREDLTVRRGRLWMETTDRPEQIDILFRRVDADKSDPVEMKTATRAGVAGLVEVSRRGHLTVVNPVGSAVMDNPALRSFLPGLARHLLGEELLLQQAHSWWCGRPENLKQVSAGPNAYAFMSLTADGSHTVVPARLSSGDRKEFLAALHGAPYAWTAQEILPLSTVPSLAGGQAATESSYSSSLPLTSTSVVLRTFATPTGNGYHLLQGGLGRVGEDPVDLQTVRAKGAVAKDVVIAAEATTGAAEPESITAPRLQGTAGLSPRVAQDMYWFGRYVERVETLSRLLLITGDRRNEFARRAAVATERQEHREKDLAGTVLGALFRGINAASGSLKPEDAGLDRSPADIHAAIVGQMADPTYPGSLAATVQHLTDSSRSLREQLSGDAWAPLNAMHRGTQLVGAGRSETSQRGLHGILDATLSVAGIMSESMIRDAAWSHLDAGRRVERAVQLVDVLRATVTTQTGTAAEQFLLESVLGVAESTITYRRRYVAAPQLGNVLDLLLLDATNPRSLRFSVNRLREALSAMRGPFTARNVEELLQHLTDLLDGVDVWQLAVANAEGQRSRLEHFLTDALSELRAITHFIATQHFARTREEAPL